MPDHSQPDKRSLTAKDTKVNGAQEELLTPKQIMGGSSTVMTHEERQAYLKNSEVGKNLVEVMEEIGTRAEARGLTPEILADILADKQNG